MVICLIYIGVIVILHIFGKVKSHNATPSFTAPEPEFEEPEMEDPDPTGGSGEL